MTDQECDFIRNYQNISFQIYIMKSYFIYDCIKNEILLEIIKIYYSNLYYEILLLSMTGSRMKFYAKIIKIYHFKFILWNYALSMIDREWDFIRNYEKCFFKFMFTVCNRIYSFLCGFEIVISVISYYKINKKY